MSGVRVVSAAALAAATLIIAGCGASPARPPAGFASPRPGSTVVHATGIETVAPLYSELGSLVTPQRITLNYQLSSTPKLLRGGAAGAVPLVASQSSQAIGGRARARGEAYVPVGFGAVSVVYNLPGVPALQLDPTALAAILSGRVSKWNARAIVADNPTVALPAAPITIVHLAAPSQLTQLLSSYLSAGSKRWRRTLGTGVTIAWPAGTAVSNETGMASIVAQTPGAIGYVSRVTSSMDGMPTARIRNPAGRFIGPTLAAMTAVGLRGVRSGHLSVGTIDAPGIDSYPIASEVYALTFRNLCGAGFSASEGRSVQTLLRYLIGPTGQALIQRFLFAPLPRALQADTQTALRRLTCGGRPL
jgi:phosphate transport system substrate-binding protein